MTNQFKNLLSLFVIIALIIMTSYILLVNSSNNKILEEIEKPLPIKMIKLQKCLYEGCYDVQVYLHQRQGLKYLPVAFCESSLNPLAENPLSTAKGVFQWTDPTWEYIGAEGHQFDYKENIKQFIKWYPIHPEWWEC